MKLVRKRFVSVILISSLACAGVAASAFAAPVLQLYVEGARYDQATETWMTSSSQFRLWVVGNTGQFGSILDVNLAAAFPTFATGSISLTPTTTSALPDGSLPGAPVLRTDVGAEGTTPLKSDGTPLASHGIYGPGVRFQQWRLGDMTLTDSPVGDFLGGYPKSFSTTGQINAYDVTITGHSVVYFDVFNHVEGQRHAFFNAAASAPAVPEPGTYLLMGIGIAGLGFRTLRRRKKS